MIKAFFNVIINLLATVIQLVVWPINLIITNAFPNFSDKILDVTTMFSTIFNSITWALGLIPTPIITVLLFIITVEIAKHTIRLSTGTLIRVWTVLQKIKFW